MNEAQLAAFAQIVSTAIKQTPKFSMSDTRCLHELEETMKLVAKAIVSDPYADTE